MNKTNKVLLIITLSVMALALIVAGLAMVFASNLFLHSAPAPSAPPATATATPEPVQSAAPTQEPAQTPTPTTSNTTVVSTLYVVNCNEWISLRSKPNTNASRLATIPLGASVGYIEHSSNGFYKIAYNGVVGYALSQYLSSSFYANSTPVAPSTTKMRVVNCQEWISLRSKPSTTASRLATIPLGATVEFLDVSTDGFYKVRYNGAVGYALSQYLR